MLKVKFKKLILFKTFELENLAAWIRANIFPFWEYPAPVPSYYFTLKRQSKRYLKTADLAFAL